MQQTEFIHSITNSIGEGLCVLDEFGRVAFVNTTALNILGWERNALMGMGFYELVYLPNTQGEYYPAQESPLKQIVNLGITIRDADAKILDKRGELIRVSYTATVAQVEGDGRFVVFLFRDLRELKRHQGLLAYRERQLAAAQARTHIGNWEWNVEDDQMVWTDELYRIFGYKPAGPKVSYQFMIKHLHPEDRAMMERLIEGVFSSREPFTFTPRIITPHGQQKTVDIHGAIRLNKQGEVRYLWGTVQDITEQRALIDARQRFLTFAQRLVDCSLDGIAAFDLEGNCAAWNPVLERLTGIKRDAVIGRPALEVFPDLEDTTVHENLRRALNGEEVIESDFEYVHAETREKRYLEIHYAPLLDEKLQLLGALVTIHDHTEQRNAHKALRLSEERFRTIYETAETGIVLLGLDGFIINANPAWQKCTGYTAAELKDINFSDLISAEHFLLYQQSFTELINGRRHSFQREIQCLTKDKRCIWINMIHSLLRDANNKPLRVIAILEDITARKAIEAELIEVKHRLGRSREDERLHLAQELHDGPIQDLYATTYQLQALKRSGLTEQQKAIFEGMEEQFQIVTDRLRSICHNLRPPSLSSFGLETAIRSYAERFQKLQPDLTINLDLQADALALPEYVRLTLFRICQEALRNVAKHAEATQVLIRFDLTDSEVLLEVQDNGKGFEVPERWIDLAREGHLGLIDAAERVDEIGGRFLILSTPDQGTIVRLTAPRP